LPTGPSHAPDTASLVVGAAPGARVPPVDNPPRHRCPWPRAARSTMKGRPAGPSRGGRIAVERPAGCSWN